MLSPILSVVLTTIILYYLTDDYSNKVKVRQKWGNGFFKASIFIKITKEDELQLLYLTTLQTTTYLSICRIFWTHLYTNYKHIFLVISRTHMKTLFYCIVINFIVLIQNASSMSGAIIQGRILPIAIAWSEVKQKWN